MANAPLCPDHKTEMRAGDPDRGGGWFCPRRTSGGGFCKQRLTEAQWKAQQVTAPTGPASLGGNSALADATVIAAALQMAGQVCVAHPDWFPTKESVSAFAVDTVAAVRLSL